MLPIEQIRRADRRTAMQLIREPLLAARLTGRELPANTGRPLRLDAPVVQPHVDEPANRCIKALVLALIQRVVDCRERLRERVRREQRSDTRTSLSRRWPTREAFLDRLEQDLQRALRGPVLAQVTRAELTAAGLNTISAHPLYARTHRIGWWALGRGLAEGGSEQDLWLPPTFELYERWCFVALRGLLIELGAHEIPPPPVTCDFAWSGELTDGTRIWLGFQVKCPSGSAKKSNAGFQSITRLRFPDLVLTIERGGERRWLVLDAKYRAGRTGLLEAMESAHIYHDSLRWHERRPDAAVILVPAQSENTAWMFTDEFRREHEVGVLVARPGALDQVAAWITTLLRDPVRAQALPRLPGPR